MVVLETSVACLAFFHVFWEVEYVTRYFAVT